MTPLPDETLDITHLTSANSCMNGANDLRYILFDFSDFSLKGDKFNFYVFTSWKVDF